MLYYLETNINIIDISNIYDKYINIDSVYSIGYNIHCR